MIYKNQRNKNNVKKLKTQKKIVLIIHITKILI